MVLYPTRFRPLIGHPALRLLRFCEYPRILVTKDILDGFFCLTSIWDERKDNFAVTKMCSRQIYIFLYFSINLAYFPLPFDFCLSTHRAFQKFKTHVQTLVLLIYFSKDPPFLFRIDKFPISPYKFFSLFDAHGQMDFHKNKPEF